MTGHMPQESINCPTGLFDRQKAEIAEATDALNKASAGSAKRIHAQKLLDATDVLLACPDHDPDSPECQICWELAELRQKVANLVITMTGLGDD